MYDPILIPLDGSERAEKILPYLGPVLAYCDARVIVLGVIDFSDTRPDRYGYVRDAATDYIQGVTQTLVDHGLRAEPMLVEGTPVETILNVASSSGVQLIAMASRGAGGFERLLGSTTERVARRADAAMMVYKAGRSHGHPSAAPPLPPPLGAGSRPPFPNGYRGYAARNG